MLVRKFLLASVAVGVSVPAMAQEYFDFGRIPGLPPEPTVQIDVNPTILLFLRETARATDPAAAELLENLEGVRLRVYKSIEDIDDVNEYVNDATGELQRANWQQVVSVSENEQVRVFVQSSSDAITGITAMVISDSEAVFVNVAGAITPQQLAQLANTLGAGEILGALGDIPVGN